MWVGRVSWIVGGHKASPLMRRFETKTSCGGLPKGRVESYC